MTDVLAAGAVVAIAVPLTRLAHHALTLRFLTKQLEHTDTSARLEVSLVVARQMGAAEPSVTPASHRLAPEKAVASRASSQKSNL